MGELGSLGIKYHTDKMKPFLFHRGVGYMDVYEKFSAHRRESIMSILEIGVKEGRSLPVWRDYYPNAQVYGLDVNPGCAALDLGDRVHITIGHQENVEALEALAHRAGGFDIVIDDGSHLVEHQIISAQALLPHVRQGGFYAIEDLSCSYMQDIGLGMQRGHWFYDYLGDDPATVHNDRAAFDRFVLDIVKRIDHMEGDVVAVHCYSQLCILEK